MTLEREIPDLAHKSPWQEAVWEEDVRTELSNQGIRREQQLQRTSSSDGCVALNPASSVDLTLIGGPVTLGSCLTVKME